NLSRPLPRTPLSAEPLKRPKAPIFRRKRLRPRQRMPQVPAVPEAAPVEVLEYPGIWKGFRQGTTAARKAFPVPRQKPGTGIIAVFTCWVGEAALPLPKAQRP